MQVAVSETEALSQIYCLLGLLLLLLKLQQYTQNKHKETIWKELRGLDPA